MTDTRWEPSGIHYCLNHHGTRNEDQTYDDACTWAADEVCDTCKGSGVNGPASWTNPPPACRDCDGTGDGGPCRYVELHYPVPST